MPPLWVPERLSPLVGYGKQAGQFTTWGVGGKPLCLLTPGDSHDIGFSLRWLTEEGISFDVLGGGSNVLIGDGDLPLVLLHMRALSGMDVSVDGQDVFIECGAGTDLRSVLSAALKSGWAGLEFAAGIPGTVGGAIFGNAGTRDGDMRGVLHEAETVEDDGSLARWCASDIEWGYRRCGLAEGRRRILSSVKLRLSVSSKESVRKAVEKSVSSRNGQPRGVKTAGCVFKNPPGDSAGRLLDLCGCKLFSVGGARVSSAHANFIENHGDCTAEDIISLAQMCRKSVYEVYGAMLEYEIKFIGIPRERLSVF